MKVHYKATTALGQGVMCALGHSDAGGQGVVLVNAHAAGFQIAPALEELVQTWASGAWLHKSGPVMLHVRATPCLPRGLDVVMARGDGEVVFLIAADSTGEFIAEGLNEVAVPWIERDWLHVGWARTSLRAVV